MEVRLTVAPFSFCPSSPWWRRFLEGEAEKRNGRVPSRSPLACLRLTLSFLSPLRATPSTLHTMSVALRTSAPLAARRGLAAPRAAPRTIVAAASER